MEGNNVFKMIDVTQFMLIESTGDSEAKSSESDLNTSSFSRGRRGFFTEFDDNNDDDDDDDNNNDDDDAESCSYGSLLGGCDDGFCHDYRNKKNVHEHDDDDDGGGMNYDDNNRQHDDDYDDDDDGDEMEEDDDAIDSKMVEVSKKCGGFVMGTRHPKRSKDCSSMDFLNIEKENDKNFWETCLAS